MLNTPDVDVVILNYCTPRLAIDAARSALNNNAGSITVVDNFSQDGSSVLLEKEIGSFAKLIFLDQNYGFGGGNNRGARSGNRPLLLLMNADTRLSPGALSNMVNVFNNDEGAGVVVPALTYPDQRLQPSAYLFITPLRVIKIMLGLDKFAERLSCNFLTGNTDYLHNNNYSGPIESPYGSCMLIRRKAFEEAGGFDEKFFIYCEETDLALRLSKKGWKIFRAADAEVVHNHGASAGQNPIIFYISMQESLKIYSNKHFNLAGRLIVFIASVLGITLRCVFSLRNNQWRKYWAGLGVWLEWQKSADPRKKG